MSASQISFSDFAIAAQQAAAPCTPPVIDTAFAVVAHPLAVGGGERLPVRGAVRGNYGCADLRDDFFDHLGHVDGSSFGSAFGAGMDAPCHLPSGSHTTLVCGAAYAWRFVILDGLGVQRGSL